MAVRLHFLAEGQTEEVLCRELFGPHFEHQGWTVTWSILTTKRSAGGGNFRGGVVKWPQVRREIVRLLDSFDLVTTMIDYYGFPPEAPGMRDRPDGPPHQRVEHVERALADDVRDHRFVPHLTLHETEAWVLAAAEALGALLDDSSVAYDLDTVIRAAGGAENVNERPQAAPSKRLQQRIPTYQKTSHGPLSVTETGLPALRERCPHLDAWLRSVAEHGDRRGSAGRH